MTFQEYFLAANDAFLANPNWRTGQAYFNTLHDVNPELADEIRGTIYDPFHRDTRMTDFIAYLAKRWTA